jgi:hypothetical protein
MLVNARLAARPGVLIALLLAATWITGCGDDPAKPVTLDVIAPADAAVVREPVVEVRGRVDPPDARVLVRGRRATVTNGSFRASVPLREGSTVIDVGASAPGASPAWTAVRVARQVLVRVPELTGASEGDAVEGLEAAGLRAEVLEDGGLLDSLLPTDWQVCEQQPEAGAKVRKGSTVHLTVSKTC